MTVAAKNILQPPGDDAFQNLSTQVVFERLRARLSEAQAGQCLRVSYLPKEIMEQACLQLRDTDAGRNADVLVLAEEPQHIWQVSATRVVELRNAEEKPLLVFMPPGARTSANDSLDVSTFAEVSLDGLYEAMRSRATGKLAANTLSKALDVLKRIKEQRRRYFKSEAEINYFLTVLENGSSDEAIGGAIYQFGLLPDYALIRDPGKVAARLDNNFTTVEKLVDARESLMVRLQSLNLKPNTVQKDFYELLRYSQSASSLNWATRIATEKAWSKLAYDELPWLDAEDDTKNIQLFFKTHGELPREGENLILDLAKVQSLQISWTTMPAPVQCPQLDHFRVEFVTTEGAVTEYPGIIKPPKGRSKNCSKKLNKLDKLGLGDGNYFLRVRAFNKVNQLINDEDPRDPQRPDGQKVNESGEFWITSQGDTIPAEVSRAARNQLVPSFAHAKFEAHWLRFLNPGADDELVLEKFQWETVAKRGGTTESLFTIQYGDRQVYTLATGNMLRSLESEILAQPTQSGGWLVDFTAPGNDEPALQHRDSGRPPMPDRFARARQNLFEAIREARRTIIVSDKTERPAYNPVSKETFLTSQVDLLLYEDLIAEYAAAYHEWLTDVETALQESAASADPTGLLREKPAFLELDTVELKIPFGLNESRLVMLLAPTHPLRLLWHLQQAHLLEDWLGKATANSKEAARRLLNESVRNWLNELVPANLPPMLLHRNFGGNELFVDGGAVGYFWQMYIATDTADSRSVRAQVESVLGLGRNLPTPSGTSREELTRKILRYLYQHPYVDLLKLNVFNPGDGRWLAEAMIDVQRVYRNLKYQVRLFTRGLDGAEVGQSLDELINPQRVVSDDQDEFILASRNHLFPKLKFSRNSEREYLKTPDAFESHLTIFLNYFAVETNLTTIGDLPGEQRSSFVYGLVQEMRQNFVRQNNGDVWQQSLQPQGCPDLTPARHSQRLADLLMATQKLQAVYAEGRVRLRPLDDNSQALIPVIELDMGEIDRRLIFLAHNHSDWVLTLDRNLSLEYFDGAAFFVNNDQTVYLLDHTPEYQSVAGERLLLTTRFNTEVVRLIRPALSEFGLLQTGDYELLALNALRSLSGRLVLKLLSSYTRREEIVSLVLAQLFLKGFGLLQNRFVIPLDAHSDLFSAARNDGSHADREKERVEKEISLKRTDLLLVEVDPDRRTLHFRLVEIKARSNVSNWYDLHEIMREQLQNTREVLRHHFDPQLHSQDRLDRPVKLRELVNLLSFYLERGVRHNLLTTEVTRDARRFLENMDSTGYNLSFDMVGVVFDFGGHGIRHFENDPALVVHAIGRDYIDRLLTSELAAQTQPTDDYTTTPAAGYPPTFREDATFEEVGTYFEPGTSGKLAQLLEKRRKATEPEPQPKVEVIPPLVSDKTPTFIPPGTAPLLSNNAPPVTNGSEPKPNPPIEEVKAPPKKPSLVDTLRNKLPVGNGKPASTFKAEKKPPHFDVLLGESHATPQYGILGRAGGRTVALDLNGCNTITLFGVQGGGKSYTLGSVVEMATRPIDGINELPSPLATVIFHYNESQDYAPEFVSMIQPNSKEAELQRLQDEFGANAVALEDVLLLTTPDKLDERKREFPSIEVEPIYFNSSELSLKDWKFLLNAVSNQSMYINQMTMIMRKYRSALTFENLLRGVEESDLTTAQKRLATMRLEFAGQFINDSYRLSDKLKPGRLLIIDVRDELMEQDETLGLFVVMLNIFANAGRDFNKLIVFDEAHKYMGNRELTSYIVEAVRQMRHQGVSILIASQDPMSLPNAIIELSSITILHRFNSPDWVKHIQRSQTALSDLSPAQLQGLMTGEAFIWANKTTDNSFSSRAVKIRCRPRATLHGGSTKTAVNH
jgi:DNA phosphorothioation-dependent restriction protein DptH